jgi:xanthine dehydrogenase accessory factor
MPLAELPHEAPPELVVLGASPVSDALIALAGPLGFSVRRSLDDVTSAADAWAVVAGLSSRVDHPAARSALERGLRYVAMVASPARGAAFADELRTDGIRTDALRAPAGLDIGALTPAEIALSILAEIVSLRRAP